MAKIAISVIVTIGVLLGIAACMVIEQQESTGVDIEGLLKLRSIVRSIDGSLNNLQNPDWGKSYTNIKRKAPARYEDGKSEPLKNLPNPRFLSESISKLEDNIVVPNEFNLTMLFGTWGQFLDHDITLSNESNTEQVVITVPRCDEFFDPNCTGN